MRSSSSALRALLVGLGFVSFGCGTGDGQLPAADDDDATSADDDDETTSSWPLGDDRDQDGVHLPDDCDDSEPSVYPGAPELCDGMDNDCDGSVDEGFTEPCDDGTGDDDDSTPGDDDDDSTPGDDDDSTDPCPRYYPDADEDGFGAATGSFLACTPPEGAFTTAPGDCDDTNASRFPGNPEVCDGLDNNCVGGVPANEADADGDGVLVCANDCDDADPSVSADEAEIICDGTDNDCDPGTLDAEDADGDGFTVCGGLDCDDNDNRVFPGQTSYYTTPRSDGSFDYDCDGVDTLYYSQLAAYFLCTAPASPCNGVSLPGPGWLGGGSGNGFSTTLPACGAVCVYSGPQITACGPDCPQGTPVGVNDTSDVACR